METEDLSKAADEGSDEFPDAFLCCVCLDLLYKPVVLSCGHVSCFWCIHKSMDGIRESHCPICRHPYSHFPNVCQMMHAVLMKMYPVAYKRRENQTIEEEKKEKVFSPQFDNVSHGLYPNQEPDNPNNPAHSFTTAVQSNLCPHRDNKNVTPCANKVQSESSSLFQDNDITEFDRNCKGSFKLNKVHSKEDFLPNNHYEDQKQVLLADVLCAACEELLFQPVVLNCGHVYCGTCIIIPEERKLTCKVCLNVHPSRSPKVCLELDHFLDEQFPTEYSRRKTTLRQSCLQLENATSCSTEASNISTPLLSLPTDGSAPWWSTLGAKIHARVGCDFCGMYPINGDRYRCKDCVEKIGFDLCGDCYNTRSKLPGRFNQQHTSEHQFELVPRRNIMLRLIRNPDPGVEINSGSDEDEDASENPENGSPASRILVGDPQDFVEMDLVIRRTLNDTAEDDQDDTQSAV